MYCKKCGTFIPSSALVCPYCGATVSEPNYPTVCPETHLTKAILLTIFCFWPLGIPAIVNAAGVESAFRLKNFELAFEKSQKAEKWCNATLITGIIVYVLNIVIVGLIVAGIWDELF